MNERMRAQIWQQLEAHIERFGWAVQGVFPTTESPGLAFAYTIGLHDKGVPELLVIGLPPEVAQPLINTFARWVLARKAMGQPLTGEFQLDGWAMVFHAVDALPVSAAEYATGAHRRSSGQARYLQLVWPDKAGLWPWDPQARREFIEAQPVLADGPTT